MKPLVADDLQHDPRVAEARKLLHAAVAEHKQKLTGVRPADPDRKQSYEEALSAFSEARGGGLYYPYIGSGFGNGPLVELTDGSIKYDFICGIGVHYWGHSHPDLLDTGIDAALTDLVMQGHLQQNREQYDLIALLLNAIPSMDHCFLTSSGVMANENALKIAFQKGHPADRILAFEKCFAGRTLTVSQITDKPGFRQGLPLNQPVDYIPFFDAKHPEESTQRALRILHQHLNRYPGQHSSMLLELVQGEGGFYTAPAEFFVALMKVLKEHNVTVIADEVQSFGRTEQLCAFQHLGLEEYVDIVTIGKLSQVCATLYKKEFKPKPGLLSQTFTSSTAAIRASQQIISTLLNGEYYGPNGRIRQVHERFSRNFDAIAERHPGLLQGPYGIGTMVAFQPFDGSLDKAKATARALFDNGVIGFIAGSNPTRIRFLVPVGAASDDDIDAVCGIVEETLVQQSELCEA